MTDQDASIQSLKNLLSQFRDERNWAQFHDAKNLAEAISIEAGELQELFLWQNSETVMEKIASDPEFKSLVEAELADVICFCINFANATSIDISTTVKKKIQENASKYPADKARNNSTKYDKL